MSPYSTSWRSILQVGSHLCLGLPCWLLQSGFPTKTLYAPRLSPIPHPSHSSWFDHPNNTWWEAEIKTSLLHSFLHSPVTLSLSDQNKFLNTPFSKESFTPIQNKTKQNKTKQKKKIKISLHLNLYIFGYQTGKQKILHWMTASIPCLWSAPKVFINGIFIS